MIVETEIKRQSLQCTLDNGIIVHISFNKDYMHINFSGTEIPMKVSSSVHSSELPSLKVGNIVQVAYTPDEWANRMAKYFQ